MAIDLGAAIKATNELLAGKEPAQRTASALGLGLLISAIFFLLPRVTFGDPPYIKPAAFMFKKFADVQKFGFPPSIWMTLEAIIFFLISLFIVMGLFKYFGPEIDEDQRTDALTPIRKELVKVNFWNLTLNGFHSGPQDQRTATIKMEMDDKWKKLRINFEIKNGMQVNGRASDVSLQLLDGGDLSLLFFIEKIAIGPEKKDEDFDYLVVVKGMQPTSGASVSLEGEWYRLSQQSADYGLRGPCQLTST